MISGGALDDKLYLFDGGLTGQSAVFALWESFVVCFLITDITIQKIPFEVDAFRNLIPYSFTLDGSITFHVIPPNLLNHLTQLRQPLPLELFHIILFVYILTLFH